MSEPNYRLRTLFQRYLSNTCTRQELEELMAALEKEPLDEALQKALELHWLNSRDAPGIPDADAKLDRLFEDTRPVLRSSAHGTEIQVRPGLRRKYYAAAAVLACALAIIGYLYLKQSARQPAVITQQQRSAAIKDVAPGSNKATLILASGKALMLDSSSNQVVQQGSTAVHLHNGSLQYDVQGTGAAISFNTLSTPRGGQFQVVLPDGTKAWLNAASKLRYPTAFSEKERVVELQGEGYFEIVKKEGQPFKVRVPRETGNALEVLALGTSFNIMAYGDEQTLNATLVEGAVKVNLDSESRLLQPGQQAAVSHRSSGISVQRVNTDHVIAWKNGYFSFNDADIQTVMRQLSRWYDVEVSYPGGIPQGSFSGEIGKGLSLAQALNLLEQARVHFRMEADRHIAILP
jgi:ferric-dicitrate binding protein FerR (iron transport regulator)